MTNQTGVQVPEAAVEVVARERWMRVRVRDANTKRRASDLAPWDHLSPEAQEQRLHEARQDLEAALPAIYEGFKERLEGEEAVDAAHAVFRGTAAIHLSTQGVEKLLTAALAAAFPQDDPTEEGDRGD